MKPVFNAWIGILMEGVAEIVMLCDGLSVDPKRFAGTRRGGPGVGVAEAEKIIDNGLARPELPLRWAEKGMLLALSVAGTASPALPVLYDIATYGPVRAKTWGRTI